MTVRNRLAATVIVVVSACALSAQWAQAAQFTSSVPETTLTATSDGVGASSHHSFDVAGASITCSQMVFDGTLKGTSASSIKITPVYFGCTFLGANVSVLMKGCEYELNAGGTVNIINQEGKSCSTSPIEWEAPGCLVTVGPQGPKTGVTYTNIKPGTSEEITMSPSITNIVYTASGFLCPSGSGTFTNGNYTTGSTIITCSPVGEAAKTVNCNRDA